MMSAKIIDGKCIANKILQSIKKQTTERITRGLRAPGLAVILLGDDSASHIYVNQKHTACKKVGFFSKKFLLPAATPESELIKTIDTLNQDDRIDGILVQTPLPQHINPQTIIETIKPDKDVDGFHPYNVGRLCQRNPVIRPCTPKGIITLLESISFEFHGAKAAIIGASNIVGRPMILELLLQGATPTIAHRFTKNLEDIVRDADLLVVAVGKPNFIPGHWIKDNAVVIDVGINRLENGKITGDVDFDSAKERASWITPVPGGVGPLTVATLLENTLYAASNLHEH